MAIRTIEYAVSVNGIVPASQQFGGTQGDHNATELKFTLSEPLRSAITSSAQGTVVYRFDGYDGSGGVRSTEPQVLTQDPCVYVLEEWITRYGGKAQVYLVITDVTDGTEMELYSFPAVLNIKDRPDGKPTDESDYDSISTLYEGARASANKAEDAAARAEQVLEDIGGAVPNIGVTEVSDGVEITVTSKEGIETAKVYNGRDGADGAKGDKGEKGDTGAQGLKGDKGDKGDDGYTPQKGVDYFTDEDIAGLNIPSVDQTYSPDSENAQSGKAVAEAISSTQDKYEFITEITLTEDSIIDIQFETPMKAVRITSNNIAVPSSGTYYWLLNGSSLSDSAIAVTRPGTSTSTKCEYFAEIYFDSGILFSKSIKTPNVYLGSNVFSGFNMSPISQNITSLRTSLKHLADSKLKIWGVKA